MEEQELKLHEEIANIERQVEQKRAELNAIKTKMSIAYQYRDYVSQNIVNADKRITELQKEFHRKAVEITDVLSHAKWEIGKFEERIKESL